MGLMGADVEEDLCKGQPLSLLDGMGVGQAGQTRCISAAWRFMGLSLLSSTPPRARLGTSRTSHIDYSEYKI